MNNPALDAVKERSWFYEFELPDGSSTRSDIPSEVLRIHTSRREKLRAIIEQISSTERTTAIDFASHEGYFSVELSRHFKNVIGLEVREQSLDAARLMINALGIDNVSFRHIDLQTTPFDTDIEAADFVLMYGLLYHLEDPVHVLRLASRLCKKHILIETQVTTFDVSGKIEDGSYQWQRDIEGVFTLVADYSHGREGGSTDVALVPSVSAIVFLLKSFGFTHIEVLKANAGDYEQFARQSRIVIHGRK